MISFFTLIFGLSMSSHAALVLVRGPNGLDSWVSMEPHPCTRRLVDPAYPLEYGRRLVEQFEERVKAHIEYVKSAPVEIMRSVTATKNVSIFSAADTIGGSFRIERDLDNRIVSVWLSSAPQFPAINVRSAALIKDILALEGQVLSNPSSERVGRIGFDIPKFNL